MRGEEGKVEVCGEGGGEGVEVCCEVRAVGEGGSGEIGLEREEGGEEEGRKERDGVIIGVTHVQYMCKWRGGG